MFEYYTISDGEQIRFYQLPHKLLEDEIFRGLSSSAKILYSVLRDRVTLSIRNKWVDNAGRVYIIFTHAEIMERIGCANQKATKCIKELQEAGLIESVRRGLGKPNIIYVKNFAVGFINKTPEISELPPENLENAENSLIHDFHDSRTINDMTQEPLTTWHKNHVDHDRSILNNHTNVIYECQSHSHSQRQSQYNNGLLYKDDGDMTLTVTPYHIIKDSENSQKTTQKTTSFDEDEDYDGYKKIIQKNINYEGFRHDPSNTPLVDGLIEAMLDVICTKSPSTVKMGDEVKSRSLVSSIYLKLNYEHISHVVDQYKAQYHQITHKNAYMRKMLYTVYQEIDAHYINQVRADGMIRQHQHHSSAKSAFRQISTDG